MMNMCLDILIEQRHAKATQHIFKGSQNPHRQYTQTDAACPLKELLNEDIVSVSDLDVYLRLLFINARKLDGHIVESHC